MPKQSAKLKRIVVLPFFLVIAAGFALSWITYINGSRASLRDALSVILRESSQRVAEEVGSRLEQATATAVGNAGFLAILHDSSVSKGAIQGVFLEQIRRTSMFAILSVGWADGEYIEIQRLQDDSIRAGVAGLATGGDLQFRRVLDDGSFGDVNFIAPGYDPRTRPWYRAAEEHGSPSWSKPYTLYSNAEPVVAATVPIYKADSLKSETLIGVTSVTLSLGTLSSYLAGLKEARNGLVYIVDSEGRLIALSSSKVVDDQGARILVAKHPNPLVAASAMAAASNTGAATLEEPESFKYTFEDTRYIGRTIPFYPGEGQEWNIVMVLDESQYAQKLRSTDIQTALLLLTFLCLSLIVGWVIVVYITEPIGVLADNADLLMPGNDELGQDVSERLAQFALRDNELGRLARAFLAMKLRLERSFGDIEASLAEKDVLLKEVHHRVKNNLQIVSSILSIQSGTLDDKRAIDAFDECQSRIQAMALVHEEVYRTGSFLELGMAGYLNRICESLNWGGGDGGLCKTAIHVDVGESASLCLEQAIPCGLVVNELVTNALKHAFTARDNGEIRVSFYIDDGVWRLSVSDDGIGLPPSGASEAPLKEGSQSEGIGGQLVEGLVLQLGGTLRYDTPQGGGTVAIVEFPAWG